MRQKGPPASEALETGLELETVRDLLHHYPRRYIDRSQVARIGDLKVDQQATVIAKVKRVDKRQTRNRRSMVTVRLYDGTGYLELTFFNQPWIANMYREGTELAVSGTIAMYRGHLQVQNQEVEILRGSEETVHTGRITPVHPATEGVTSRTIRELVFRALEQLAPIPDPAAGADRGGGVALLLRRGDPHDPLPRDAATAGAGEGAAEVRRAVHARARGRVPQGAASTRRRSVSPTRPTALVCGRCTPRFPTNRRGRRCAPSAR